MNRRSLRVTGAQGVLILSTLGCSGLRSEADTYQSTRGALSPWGCVGQAQDPIESVPSVTYRTDVVDWVTFAPPPGLQVCVCAQVDVPPPDPSGKVVACDAPIGGCFSPPPAKNVSIQLPGRADIFLAFLTPTTVPDALYFNRPLPSNLDGGPPIRLITFSTAQNLAASFGLSLDPTLGIVVMRIFDCNGIPAAGVKFILDPSPANIIPFAYQNNAPSPLLKVTDETGQFGFGNAKPGSALATAYRDDGTANPPQIGSVAFPVRAGWATLVDLRP